MRAINEDLEQANTIVNRWWQSWGGMCPVSLAGQSGLVEEIARALADRREANAKLAERLLEGGRAWRIADAIREH